MVVCNIFLPNLVAPYLSLYTGTGSSVLSPYNNHLISK